MKNIAYTQIYSGKHIPAILRQGIFYHVTNLGEDKKYADQIYREGFKNTTALRLITCPSCSNIIYNEKDQKVPTSIFSTFEEIKDDILDNLFKEKYWGHDIKNSPLDIFNLSIHLWFPYISMHPDDLTESRDQLYRSLDDQFFNISDFIKNKTKMNFKLFYIEEAPKITDKKRSM